MSAVDALLMCSDDSELTFVSSISISIKVSISIKH